MTTRVLIFGLLCNFICTCFNQVVVQTSSTHDVVPECAKLPCASAIIRRKADVNAVNDSVQSYAEKLENYPLKLVDKALLKVELRKIRNLTDEFMAMSDSDFDTFCRIPDAEARRVWCLRETEIHLRKLEDIILAENTFRSNYITALENAQAQYGSRDQNEL